jgi:signal transduction histidine kinase
MVLPLLIALITSFLHLLFAILLWRKPKEEYPMASAFGFFMFLFFLWGGFQSVYYANWISLPDGVAYPHLLFFGIGIISLAYLDMTRRFNQLPGLHVVLWVLALLFVGGQVALAIVQPPLGLPTPVSVPQVLAGLSLGMGIVFTLITGYLIFNNHQLKNNPLHRNRLSYWAITIIFVTLGNVTYIVNAPAWGNIFFGIAAFNTIYVVTTHRHPDIRLGILHALSYLMTTVLVVVIYTLVYMTAQFIFQERLGSSPLTAGVVMALVLAIIFRPLFEQIRKNIEIVLGQEDSDNNQIIREYSLSISNILNLEQLATVSTGLISESLDTRRGMLFLTHQFISDEEQGRSFKLIPVDGGMGMNEMPPSVTLTPYSTVAIFLSTQHRPLIQYDIDYLPLFNTLPAEERTWFSALSMDVYLPIYSKGIWIGMLAVGPKASGVPYSEMELNLMSTLADQTAVALENARLVEGILQVNLQLEVANDNLEKTKNELERLDKAKSDFISIASHELRTPLTVIQGYAQMLHEDAATGENAYHKNLLEGIASGVERLHNIVESMLDVAKIDGRELQLSPVPIPIHSIISSVCRTMTKAIESRKLTLEISDMHILRPIEVDREAIQKVFYHLINNAVKYTPDGGSITVLGRMLPRGNDLLASEALEIVVKDTGIGIDPENQELIFRKFFRTGEIGLHSSGRTKFKGAGPGLGLAIAQGVVEAHGGRIWVESAGYDEVKLPGSQFHVVLPVRQYHPYGQTEKAG